MTTLYLIRHAQSHQHASMHHADWPLSARGQEQAQKLVPILKDLQITRLYSSPFKRCRETIQPFAEHANLNPTHDEELREQLLADGLVPKFETVWIKTWEDFDYCLPDCETANAAQKRFSDALKRIAKKHRGETVGVSTHGMVIALALNSIDPNFRRTEAEQIRNPEVIKLTVIEDQLAWVREYKPESLHEFGTLHSATPVNWDANPSSHTQL